MFTRVELAWLRDACKLALEEHKTVSYLRLLIGRIDEELDEERIATRRQPTIIAELLAAIEHIPALPRCPICGGVMHADNTEFIAMNHASGGVFRHKCEEQS